MKLEANITVHVHNHAEEGCITAKLNRIEGIGAAILDIVKANQASQAQVDALTAKLRGSSDSLSQSVQEHSPIAKE